MDVTSLPVCNKDMMRSAHDMDVTSLPVCNKDMMRSAHDMDVTSLPVCNKDMMRSAHDVDVVIMMPMVAYTLYHHSYSPYSHVACSD